MTLAKKPWWTLLAYLLTLIGTFVILGVINQPVTVEVTENINACIVLPYLAGMGVISIAFSLFAWLLWKDREVRRLSRDCDG